MRNLDAVADALDAALSEKDAAREYAITRSREIVRLSGTAIRTVHRGGDPEEALAAATEAAEELEERLLDHPDVYHSGPIENALQEVAEAHLVVAAHRGEDFPAPEELPVTPQAYVLGLGDLVGELRRMALDALGNGDVAEAKRLVDEMEDVFGALMRFDYPSALVEVRRKQDIARNLLERTRGEVAVAVSGKRLEDRMTNLQNLLDEMEKPKREGKARERKGGDLDLDVDSVYK